MAPDPATLLVTGGSGFIGRHIIPILKDTYRIISIGRTPARGVDHLPVTLTDYGSYPRHLPDLAAVIHLAALTRKTNPDPTPVEQYRSANVTATETLLHVLSVHPPRHFVYVSTCDVYTDVPGIIGEEGAVAASNAYTASKLEAESMVRRWGRENGVGVAVVRLGNIYGPGDETYGKFIPVATTQAIGQKPISIKGQGRALRDVLYVTDAARSLATVVRSGAVGLYSSVSGRAVSVKSIAECINAVCANPSGLSFTDPSFPETDRLFSAARLTALGWAPKISLADGIASEASWLRLKASESS